MKEVNSTKTNAGPDTSDDSFIINGDNNVVINIQVIKKDSDPAFGYRLAAFLEKLKDTFQPRKAIKVE